RYYLIWAIVVVMVFISIGSYVGHEIAVYHCNQIALAVLKEHPDDPLDMLWGIGFGIWFAGTFVGTILGLGCGIVLYFWLRHLNQQDRIKSNQQPGDAYGRSRSHR